MVFLADMPDWAGSRLPRNRTDRNAIELPRYARIEAQFATTAQRLVDQHLTGQLDAGALVRRFGEALEQAEYEAFAAGRRAGGRASADVSPAEARMLAGRHDRQMRFFRRFVGDMQAGRGRVEYKQRAGMYAEALWSLYTRGESVDWDEVDPENTRWDWILDPDAEHCRDCLERAKISRDNGGLTWDQLVEFGWPGETSICGRRCRCHVRQRRPNRGAKSPMDPTPAGPAGTAAEGIEQLMQMVGGPAAPLPLPAAGLPAVRVAPHVLESAPASVAPLLPMVPKALTRPDAIIEVGDGMRRYYGLGLDLLLARSVGGRWFVVAVALDHDARRAA